MKILYRRGFTEAVKKKCMGQTCTIKKRFFWFCSFQWIFKQTGYLIFMGSLGVFWFFRVFLDFHPSHLSPPLPRVLYQETVITAKAELVLDMMGKSDRCGTTALKETWIISLFLNGNSTYLIRGLMLMYTILTLEIFSR